MYLLGGEYYVIDGHRRVAAALKQKLEYMDAQVTECIPLDDAAALEGAAARRRFEQETGLRNVRLGYESGYTTLLEEIADYALFRASGAEGSAAGGAASSKGLAQREFARRWHSEAFRPACTLLAGSELSRRFSGTKPGDLYVIVARFYRDLMGGYPPGASYPTLLSGFRFARGLPDRRPLRATPFRLLLSLLGLRRSNGGGGRRREAPWRRAG